MGKHDMDSNMYSEYKKGTIDGTIICPLSELDVPKEVLEAIKFDTNGDRLLRKPVESWLKAKKMIIESKTETKIGGCFAECRIIQHGENKEVVLETTIHFSIKAAAKDMEDILRKENPNALDVTSEINLSESSYEEISQKKDGEINIELSRSY